MTKISLASIPLTAFKISSLMPDDDIERSELNGIYRPDHDRGDICCLTACEHVSATAAALVLFRRIRDGNLTRLLTRHLSLPSSSSWSSCKVVMRVRVRVRSRVVMRMSRREQDGKEADA